MKFGITDEQTYAQEKLKREALYSKLIPHKVFFWKPKRLKKRTYDLSKIWKHGQYAWLENGWRVAEFDESGNVRSINYFETEKEARHFSQDKHQWMIHDISIDEALRECIRSNLYTS